MMCPPKLHIIRSFGGGRVSSQWRLVGEETEEDSRESW